MPTNKTKLIAEVGINHNGDVELARKMIREAHARGADLIKLQSFVMEEFFSPALAYYNESAEYSLSMEEQRSLFDMAVEEGIPLMTTPFEFTSLAFLDSYDLPAYKIASMDCDNYSLIQAIAERGKQVYLSTGMATLGEIEKAVDTVSKTGNNNLVLLHCVSNYPTEPSDVNLAYMKTLERAFGLPIGLSDHTIGLQSAQMAATLGAAVVEKHFTLDPAMIKDYPGADHDISITPDQVGQLRAFFDDVPLIMGDAHRPLNPQEREGRETMRRGWYAKRDIAAGEILSLDNLEALRPAQGIPAGSLDVVNGKKAAGAIPSGAPILWTHLSEAN